MKILLIGEYSNVHATLAEGLRALGQHVTVVSNGDFWKTYPRDIDLSRKPGKRGGMAYLAHTIALLPKLTGYDVVQLINPMFLELKAQRIAPIYKFLRKHNKKVFLGAFGMDYYWVHENITRKPLRYSDFNIGDTLRTDDVARREQRDWIGTAKERLNKMIAADCDGIIAGLYEYWVCYKHVHPGKTTFIPYPIKPKTTHPEQIKGQPNQPLRLFIGISKGRSAYKGTDVMLAAAKAIKAKYPNKIDLRIAEGVPFEQYAQMMNGSDAILDQLYSYTPSMNPLEAMSRGIICVGGGEPENYEILGDKDLKPIINVQPSYDSVCKALEGMVNQPEETVRLKSESIEYILRYHHYIKVAQQYLDFYQTTGKTSSGGLFAKQ